MKTEVKVATSNANVSENATKVASVELKENNDMKEAGTVMNMEMYFPAVRN